MMRSTTLTPLVFPKQVTPSVFVLFLLLCGILSEPITAANSPLGYAYPVAPLQIDGDLSDWPKSIPSYALDQIPFGQAVKDGADFKAHFQVAYNLDQQFLYVAMTVMDDVHYVDNSENAGWNNQDIHNLYIDRKHLYSGSGVNLFVYNEQFKEIVNASTSWDPDAKKADWKSVVVKAKCSNNTCVYEWQIHLPGDLTPGKTIGIDHVVTDRDPEHEDSNFLSWSSGGGKSRAPGRLGDVLLMKAKDNLGTLNGQLRWKDASIKGHTGKIKLTSVSDPACWTVAEVDSTGRYTLQLPEGKYQVAPYWHIYYEEEREHRMDDQKDMVNVLVRANAQVEAPVLHLSSLPIPNKIPTKGILHDLNEQRIAELDQFIVDYQQYYEIPGVSLALIKDGKVVYHQTYGTKNSFTNEPVDDKTLFE
ncbi:MAG: sugar-binding protein, partial [Bacteroidota bacterium]